MADGRGAIAGVGSPRCQPMPHCRRLSSSSESGFHSDLSDEHNSSPTDVTDAAVRALNGLASVETGFLQSAAVLSFRDR